MMATEFRSQKIEDGPFCEPWPKTTNQKLKERYEELNSERTEYIQCLPHHVEDRPKILKLISIIRENDSGSYDERKHSADYEQFRYPPYQVFRSSVWMYQKNRTLVINNVTIDFFGKLTFSGSWEEDIQNTINVFYILASIFEVMCLSKLKEFHVKIKQGKHSDTLKHMWREPENVMKRWRYYEVRKPVKIMEHGYWPHIKEWRYTKQNQMNEMSLKQYFPYLRGKSHSTANPVTFQCLQW